MKKISIFLLLTLSQPLFANNLLLSLYCEEYNGKIKNSYKCPKSKLIIPLKFCIIQRENKPPLFFDGCSGPSGGHRKLFFPHCIEHDLCYHREPSTNGRPQVECDIEFYINLLHSCTSLNDTPKRPTRCQKWAAAMYRAVRMLGTIAYNCADYNEK